MSGGSSKKTRWHVRLQKLTIELHALYLVCRDPRVSWPARAVAFLVVAYAFSPIDLIPDAIPVLGYLDDLVVLPLGILLVLKMVPPDVMQDCRSAARETQNDGKHGAAAGTVLVLTIWTAILAVAVWVGRRWIP
ncbi:MAG TPA: YkvA family protein [Desulfosarcina sp.]|nr:YkvA family protein [Desulfosarcina sp.]